ncbi:MAG: hypothetical protein ACI8RE_001725, partial [Ilumatobacter sp.]
AVVVPGGFAGTKEAALARPQEFLERFFGLG